MTALQIIFVLANLAVPYFIYTSRMESPADAIEADKIESTTLNILQAMGGLPPCKNSEVAQTIRRLCEQSVKKWDGKNPITIQRASLNTVIGCEASSEEVRVTFFHEKGKAHTMDCESKSRDVVAFSPAFHMKLNGLLKSIEYSNSKGQRNKVPFTDCRQKLKTALGLKNPPKDERTFLRELGHSSGISVGPEEGVMQNQICLSFDPSPNCVPFREKYRR